MFYIISSVNSTINVKVAKGKAYNIYFFTSYDNRSDFEKCMKTKSWAPPAHTPEACIDKFPGKVGLMDICCFKSGNETIELIGVSALYAVINALRDNTAFSLTQKTGDVVAVLDVQGLRSTVEFGEALIVFEKILSWEREEGGHEMLRRINSDLEARKKADGHPSKSPPKASPI